MKKHFQNLAIAVFFALSPSHALFAQNNEVIQHNLNIVGVSGVDDFDKIKKKATEFSPQLEIIKLDLEAKILTVQTDLSVTKKAAVIALAKMGYTTYYLSEDEIISADQKGNITSSKESAKAFETRKLEEFKKSDPK